MKMKNAIESLLATVKCAWSKAVFNFEQTLDAWLHPGSQYFANAGNVAATTDSGYPNAAKRHLDGIITYLANSTQTLSTTAPWTNRYQCVIFGNDSYHCYLSGSAGEFILGIAMDSPYQAGEPVMVAIPNAYTGTVLVMATGAIKAGTIVQSNGDGTVAAWAFGSTAANVGVLLTASTATGDYCEMSLGITPGSSHTAIAYSGATFTF